MSIGSCFFELETLNLPRNLNFSDPVSTVALSGNGTTCVFGSPVYDSSRGRVYVTQDLGATYTTFEGDNFDDWFGYYVSSNYDGTRIVANSSNGNVLSNYIKIFTLETSKFIYILKFLNFYSRDNGILFF